MEVGIQLTAIFSLFFLSKFLCSSAQGNSYGLSYNGGKIMTEPATVSLLWFGTGWEEAGREAIRNAINSLTPSRYPSKDSNQVPTLGNWWEIITQYRDSSNAPVTDRIDVGAECFYTGLQSNMTLDQVVKIGGSVFNKSSIDGFGKDLKCTRVFEMDNSSSSSNNIYHVLFSQTVMFLDSNEQREILNLCSGNFEVEVFEGKTVKMAWARAPQDSTDHCSTFFRGDSYLGPPNGDEKIDSLVSFVLSGIAEEVTNGDGRGWISNDGSGMTATSSCVSPFPKDKDGFPLFSDSYRNVSFNALGLNGYKYMVQYIWDQNIMNCALKLSETCAGNAVMLKQPKGFITGGITVNRTNGLQPYPPNQRCRWKINYPAAKFISITINYLLVAAESDDHLVICESDSSFKQCSTLQSSNVNSNNFKLVGSNAYIEFKSGDHVSPESRGWELSYSAGFCNGKRDVYDHEGVVSYTSSAGFSYAEGLSCQWVFHGKPGTLVSLSFTHINISKGLDFLAIYNGTMRQIANFTGVYSSSDLPQMNLTGEVILLFSTQTDQGEGWSANFYISSPVDRSKKLLFVVLAVVVAVVAISFSLAFITLAILKRRRKYTHVIDSNEDILLSIGVEINGEENRIGEGPRAVVYKAVLTDGSSVAVKCPKDTTSRTDLEEKILLKFSSHPNIISIVGYAQDRIQKRYLVFEFMGRGDLAWNLREKGETLDWNKRLAIALQISSAIQNLHMYFNPPIYHGNITSENILLDDVCNAKLGGFGTANYCKTDETGHEKLSKMAEDIQSFGLVLAMLLRGKPLTNRLDSEEINELDTRLCISKEEGRIMGLVKLGEISNWCIGNGQKIGGQESSPKIGDVVLSLKQEKSISLLNLKSIPSAP